MKKILCIFVLILIYFFVKRRIASKKSDKRINLISEIFSGIKIIKMYCWEEPFDKIVEVLRKYKKIGIFLFGLEYLS